MTTHDTKHKGSCPHCREVVVFEAVNTHTYSPPITKGKTLVSKISRCPQRRELVGTITPLDQYRFVDGNQK